MKPLPGMTLGFDAYYKISQNLLDEGQFGAPIFLTSFNYADANIKGWELTASYDDGPWSVYGNVAWSQALATNIISAQFNFAASELAFIARTTYTSTTTRAGPPRRAPPTPSTRDSSGRRAWAPISSTAMGCARRWYTPNDSAVPAYAVFNLSAAQKIPIKGTRGAQLRLDVLNVFDNSYQIRTAWASASARRNSACVALSL